jgi:hypothetical protein
MGNSPENSSGSRMLESSKDVLAIPAAVIGAGLTFHGTYLFGLNKDTKALIAQHHPVHTEWIDFSTPSSRAYTKATGLQGFSIVEFSLGITLMTYAGSRWVRRLTHHG